MTLKEIITLNMSKNKEHELKYIWSQAFWEKEATRIEMAYWELIKDRIPHGKEYKGNPPVTEHRIEKFVRKLSKKKKIPNLHVGLTSSDLEDNIRIERLRKSRMYISKLLLEVMHELCKKIGGPNKYSTTITAFTHLMPAGKILPFRRFEQTKENLVTLCDDGYGRLRKKGIGGALGDMRVQEDMGITAEDIGKIFPNDEIEKSPLQASDKRSDYDVATWILAVGSYIGKIAGDIRMMFALGQARYDKKDIGSTALAHKSPNPWRWERISGMLTSLLNLPGVVAMAIANCHLERTLTDQSVLNAEMFRGFTTLEMMLEDAISGLNGVEIIYAKKKVVDSEDELLHLIKKGMGRLTAHLKINAKYNGQEQ